MTQNVSSMSVASASCSVLVTQQSHSLRIITGGQPTITRLLGKLSVVTLRCMERRLKKGIKPPLLEPRILEARAVPKAKEIGLHPVTLGSPVFKKIQMAPPAVEVEIEPKLSIPRKQRKCPWILGQG